MAAVSATNPYGALTLSVQVLGASETETQLAANAVVVGFVCGESNRSRKYNPYAEGFAPTTGDAANKWLPYVGSVTAITEPGGAVGEYLVTLIPGSSDVVNVASVQTVRVDASTLFIVASGTF